MGNPDASALLDAHGRPLVQCQVCHAPLSAADLADLGLRAPDGVEMLHEYCEAELVDISEFCHRRCRAGEARSA